MPEQEYYVIHSDKFGIYLGSSSWSGINHGNGRERAPCWKKTTAIRIMSQIASILLEDHRLTLKPVYPDRVNNFEGTASEEACARAGLKRWDAKMAERND